MGEIESGNRDMTLGLNTLASVGAEGSGSGEGTHIVLRLWPADRGLHGRRVWGGYPTGAWGFVGLGGLG